MKSVLIAAAAALALSGGTALAAGNGAIANQTTTSMGSPSSSPSYSAPRSEVVPGTPEQEKRAQESNEMPGSAHPASKAPVGAEGHAQVTR